MIAMLINRKKFIVVLFSLFIAGCITPQPTKPLDSKLSAANLLDKDPNSEPFKQYLMSHGYTEEELPFAEWGVDELTYCALFYHTKLNIAKQELALSKLATESASIKNIPTVNADIAHSNQKNEDIKPWSYGLSVDIPIETTNKRAIRIEKAEINVDVARMNVAETAWQLRNQIAIDLIAYHQNLAETQLAQQELSIQTNIVSMLEKRVSAGIASNTELSNVNLMALKTKRLLSDKQGQLKQINAKLAADVGLTPDKFSYINIKPLSIEKTLLLQAKQLNEPLESKELQKQALLNRIDIRRGIAKYAAAETEIKLKVAQQTPDITLSPGILFEFGDKIWSLGFSSLLNMLHKNTALIEEAKQLREIEGAQFEHLQAEIIAHLNQTHASYLAAQQTAEQAKQELNQQRAQEQEMKKQFDAGLIGRLDLMLHARNTLIAEQQLITSEFELLQIANQIEDLMQKPLYTTFKMPYLNAKRQNDDQ
jgi:outer membrane protein, heavy metal efflux system